MSYMAYVSFDESKRGHGTDYVYTVHCYCCVGPFRRGLSISGEIKRLDLSMFLISLLVYYFGKRNLYTTSLTH